MISATMISKLITLLLLVQLISAATVTLLNMPAYGSQRPCARGCFTRYSHDGPDNIAAYIQCDYYPVENDCFCRPDLQTTAEASLSACVSQGCARNQLDIDVATKIYIDYCSNAGYVKAVEASTTPTTTSTQGTPYSISTVTVTAIHTVLISSGERRVRSPFEELAAIFA
jgi:hypothetical protein